MKLQPEARPAHNYLQGKTLAMIFEKNSTPPRFL
jgi:ornithine carbamoyltransferase